MSGRSPAAGTSLVPALRFHWLTRLYDPIVAVTTRESVFRRRLLAQASLQPGDRVLGLGCGSGTMALLIRHRHPAVEVAGLDGDPEILARARAKARHAGADIRFDEGLSWCMPYADMAFDAVFSSLFFHHLHTDDKKRTLREVLRVLRPGGALHICDWGRPANPLLRLSFNLVRLLDGFEVTAENASGLLPQIVRQAGFTRVEVMGTLPTISGVLEFIAAEKR